MKINSITTLISFQKKFMTNATILKNGKNHECPIYELDSIEDKDYFEKVTQDKDWKNADHLHEIKADFPENFPRERTYTIEDTNEKCLGFINIENCPEGNKIEISLLETCPKYARKNAEREIKGIGQALINFLIALAKEKKINSINIPIVQTGAESFYEKCGFNTSIFPEDDVMLTAKEYDNALKKNKYVKTETQQ